VEGKEQHVMNFCWPVEVFILKPLMPYDLKRRRTVSLLKIKIPSKNMREKPTNATIIHLVY
jgi:hypothetical protein